MGAIGRQQRGGGPGRAALPPSLRLRRDPETTRPESSDGGVVLLGGSPLKLLRLRAGAAAAVDALLDPDGTSVDVAAASLRRANPRTTPATLAQLARRLLDCGVLHPDPGPRPPRADEVTIVVPAHNRARSVARLLRALDHDPDLAGISRVVVDDGSTDDTGEVAARLGATVIRTAHPSGPAGARTTGLGRVDTPVVAFVDSDCVPSAGWLSRLLPHLDDPAVAVAAPRITAHRADDRSIPTSLLERYERSRSALDLGPRPGLVRPRSRVPYVPAAALVVRLDALVDVGGFDTSMLVGEDVDLVWRLAEAGWSVRYEPRAEVAHEHRTTWTAFVRRRYDYGTSAGPLARRHPDTLPAAAVSGSSAAAWALATLGGPAGLVAGLAVAAASTALLPRKLRALSSAWPYSLRLAGRGHLGAGKVLAAGLTRSWLPITVPAAVLSLRCRRTLALAVVLPALDEWRQRRPELDPVRWVAVRALDDAAYCAGVWRGCLTARTTAPLRPDLRSWPGRGTSDTRSERRRALAGWGRRLRRTPPGRSHRSPARP